MKLGSMWDKRLILSNTRKLASMTNYMSKVYIKADEPLEERRKKTLKRLKMKAERELKQVNNNNIIIAL